MHPLRGYRLTLARHDNGFGSRLSAGVDHVDLLEPRGHGAVTHRVHLTRLPLAIEEAAAELVARLAADHVHGVPEIRGPHLIRDVLEHPRDLPATDLVEHLPAELRVEALLIDRERTVALDRD